MGEKYVLVYGLSAHPIHQEHVDLVIQAVTALTARGRPIVKVIIIPVYRRNPVGARHKDDLPETFDHRFAMCVLAANEIARRSGAQDIQIEVSRIEEEIAQGREEPNYTVETLSALRSRETNVQLIFLLGSDLVSGEAPELGRWREPDRLGQLATLAICPRPGYPPNPAFLADLSRRGAQIIALDEVVTQDVATSRIRQRLEAGEDPSALSDEGLLPAPVARYIKEHYLYPKRVQP